ncbi:39S ribosomal protein L2, mitochondrial [Lamellibrachia satsuma]|nr:39S ribosomal protein L2, mitochondrial [Lamellibrachia satsuma]
MYEYTVRPLPFPKTGGRGPNGRIWYHRRGGGHKRNFRMIDWVRGGPTQGPPLLEKIDKIMYDPNRSARIALVATAEKKRYIVATQNMKAGDIIKSSQVLSKTAVRAAEGDSYPLGSLPVGTLVNCVEFYPGQGGLMARAAGETALLVRKVNDRCIVRMPSKREVSLDQTCVATVGRVSNVDHNKRVIGKAGRNRWLGIRPKSGRWHRKDGRFGRKIKPVKKLLVYTKPPPPKQDVYRLTV